MGDGNLGFGAILQHRLGDLGPKLLSCRVPAMRAAYFGTLGAVLRKLNVGVRVVVMLGFDRVTNWTMMERETRRGGWW